MKIFNHFWGEYLHMGHFDHMNETPRKSTCIDWIAHKTLPVQISVKL